MTLFQGSFQSPIVIRTDLVMKRSLMNYRGDTYVPFIKITIKDQRSLPKARDEWLTPYSSHLSLI